MDIISYNESIVISRNKLFTTEFKVQNIIHDIFKIETERFTLRWEYIRGTSKKKLNWIGAIGGITIAGLTTL